MRKGRFAVVLLGNLFLKTLKMYSQLKSLRKTSKLTCIAIILHILFPTTHTACCFHHIVLTELKLTSDPSGQLKVLPKWGNDRPNFERCVHVGQPIFEKYVKKIEKFIQTITPFICRKAVQARRVTFPAESTLSIVRMTKKVAPFDSVNGWLSQFWIHTDFYIPSSTE